MRSDRLLAALLLLQARGRMTGRQLAKRLEVSMRTVHRDMEALGAAGVPILALRGAHGGWELDEGWRTEVPGLDEAELNALLMAQPRVVGDTRLARAAEGALRKLMAALPPGMRARAATMRQRLYVDTTAWRGIPENLTLLPVVQEAVSRDRKLEFRYLRAGKEAALRIVDPLGLVAKGTAWYLVAGTSDGPRTYRVSRMEQARILDTASARPAHFDLEEYWKNATEKFREGLPSYRVTLLAEATVAEEMKHWRPVAVEQGPHPDPRGWRRLKVEFDDPGQALFVVQGLGANVEVEEPRELRELVHQNAASVAARPAARGPA